MTARKKLIGIAMVLLASTLVVGFSGSTPPTGKIDPMLSLMTMKGANLKMAKSQGIVKSAPGVAEPLVGTILRFKGDLSGVESLGGRVRSIIGDIATVDIPLSAVSKVAQLPNIVYIESAKPVKPRLNLSVPETGADTLRSGTAPNWTGATGKDVVIGIVDTGIDLNHSDFKDASGKTRVLYLWDQAATTGTPPAGLTYGNECTKAVIDAGGCTAATTTDTGGHGTHVAGIAAGNGAATGNGQAAYRYLGMAPEADLIIVNSLNGATATNAVVDGITYIQAKATALGKPCVINLSLGSHNGPHDGTSNYEKALDEASGIGKVIVGAAGNEAERWIHASGTVSQGTTTQGNFNVTSADKIDIWYAGADKMGIVVTNGTCTTSQLNPGETQSFDTSCGKIGISSSGVNPNNGDREIAVELSNGTSQLVTGAWAFVLTGNTISSTGRFDAWSAYEKSNFPNADTEITLDDSGTATKPISVASYITRPSNGSTKDPQNPIGDAVGNISSFSSRGPRRSCSDTSKCPSVRKPDITAPGGRIMSAYSANTATMPDSVDLDVDGVHLIMSGTSMATPHVTGAVALLLQAAPTLTSDQIKSILTSNTKAVDSYTGTLPNNTWGYGKLDVKAALTALKALAPKAPNSLTATAGNASAVLNWAANTESDLNSYNIYFSPTSGSGYIKLTAIPKGFTTANASNLTNGTTYYFVITAVNDAGQESGYSAEVSVTPAAPATSSGSSSGGGGGCFIATAAYGSYLDPHVEVLRKFRDANLITNAPGRAFVKVYYQLSPPIADFIKEHEALKTVTRFALTPVVYGVKYPVGTLMLIGFATGLAVYRRKK